MVDVRVGEVVKVGTLVVFGIDADCRVIDRGANVIWVFTLLGWIGAHPAYKMTEISIHNHFLKKVFVCIMLAPVLQIQGVQLIQSTTLLSIHCT